MYIDIISFIYGVKYLLFLLQYIIVTVKYLHKKGHPSCK